MGRAFTEEAIRELVEQKGNALGRNYKVRSLSVREGFKGRNATTSKRPGARGVLFPRAAHQSIEPRNATIRRSPQNPIFLLQEKNLFLFHSFRKESAGLKCLFGRGGVPLTSRRGQKKKKKKRRFEPLGWCNFEEDC